MAADPADRPADHRVRTIRARNRALSLVLLGLVALFYAIAIVKMGAS